MKKVTIALGVISGIFAIADLLHGQHNGDAHRGYIHTAEFVSFFGFLSLLEVHLFQWLNKPGMSRWQASLFAAVISMILGFALFAFSGGSFHGDGGPLAFNFLFFAWLGMMCTPIAILGCIGERFMRKS